MWSAEHIHLRFVLSLYAVDMTLEGSFRTEITEEKHGEEYIRSGSSKVWVVIVQYR